MTVFGCHLPSCLPICPAFPPHHSTPPGSTTTPTPPRSIHPAHPISLSLCLSVSVFLSLFSHASTSQFVLIKVFVFYKACMICPLQNNIDSRTDSYLFACCIPVTFNTRDGTEFCKKGHIMASIEYCLYQFTTAIWLLTISNLVMRSLLELYTMLTSFITPFLSKITLPQSCGK